MGAVQERIRLHFAALEAAGREALLAALDSQRCFALLDALDQLLAEPPLTARAAKPRALGSRPRRQARLRRLASTRACRAGPGSRPNAAKRTSPWRWLTPPRRCWRATRRRPARRRRCGRRRSSSCVPVRAARQPGQARATAILAAGTQALARAGAIRKGYYE